MKFDHDRFAAVVQASGATVTSLAISAGISRQTIYDYMSGAARPGGEPLAALARALGCQMEHFFCPACTADSTEVSDAD